MAVKRTSSFASCWAQGRNKTVLRERNSSLAEFLLDEMWRRMLAFMVDIQYFAVGTRLIHLCNGFAQISLYGERRQTHSKRNWHFEIALRSREIERCFLLWIIFGKCWCQCWKVIKHYKLTSVGISLRLWVYYFPEYENPRKEAACNSFGQQMIATICCIHCDCMLPVRKNFGVFLPVRWGKKVENHGSIQPTPFITFWKVLKNNSWRSNKDNEKKTNEGRTWWRKCTGESACLCT